MTWISCEKYRSNSVGMGWCMWFHISKNLPSDTDDFGMGKVTLLENIGGSESKEMKQ